MNELKTAFDKTLDEKVFSTIDMKVEPQFSKRFERTMGGLLRRRANKNVSVKRAAVASVIIAAGFLVLSLTGIGSPSGDMRLRQRGVCLEVSFVESDSPERIFYAYQLPLAEGFRLTEAEVGQQSVYFVWENGEERLHFSMYVKNGFRCNVGTSRAPAVKTEVNGNQGFYVDNDSEKLLSWDNGDYFLQLSGTFSIEQLNALAQGMEQCTVDKVLEGFSKENQ